jgi:hypothetical protein
MLGKLRDDSWPRNDLRGRLRFRCVLYRNLPLSESTWRLVDPRSLRSRGPHLNPVPKVEADASAPGEVKRTKCNSYDIIATRTGPHAVSTILPIA